MAGRRRKWLVAAALTAIVAAVGWWMRASRESPMVRLIFVGYTNLHPRFFTALVLAKNTSGAPIVIGGRNYEEYVVRTDEPASLPPGFAAPWPLGGPRILQPGESTVVEVGLLNGGESWWTQLAAQREKRTTWLHAISSKLDNSAVQTWVNRLFPPPEVTYFKIGPITNLPPQTERSPAWRQQRRGARRDECHNRPFKRRVATTPYHAAIGALKSTLEIGHFGSQSPISRREI